MAPNTLMTPNLTEIIESPATGELTAYKDSFDNIEIMLCYKSGMMSTSVYLDGTEKLEHVKTLTPPEIWAVSIVDKYGYRWFPSVFASKEFFMYASPTSSSYKWLISPIVKVLEAESHLYTNPETQMPYEYRLAEESAMAFERDDFYKALCSIKSKTPEIEFLINKIKNLFNL